MVSVSVLVPVDRLADFYSTLGKWHVGDAVKAAAAKPARVAPPRPSGRYAPFSEFLLGISGDSAEFSFEEVEVILGRELPASSRRHKSFWANSSDTSQGRSWVAFGWRVTGLDWENQLVSFGRSAG